VKNKACNITHIIKEKEDETEVSCKHHLARVLGGKKPYQHQKSLQSFPLNFI
jgi:hypothetical protein